MAAVGDDRREELCHVCGAEEAEVEEEAEDYTFIIQNTSVVKFDRFYTATSEPWQTVSDNGDEDVVEDVVREKIGLQHLPL